MQMAQKWPDSFCGVEPHADDLINERTQPSTKLFKVDGNIFCNLLLSLRENGKRIVSERKRQAYSPWIAECRIHELRYCV